MTTSQSVDIFDTNVWIQGFAGNIQQADQLITEAANNNRRVAVSAYIVEEFFQATNRAHNNAGTLQTAFMTLIQAAQNIHSPIHQQVVQMDLSRYKSKNSIQLLAEILDIQPKDAPIVEFAKEYEAHDPTIYTNDRSFAQLNPSNYGLNWLSIQHVS